MRQGLLLTLLGLTTLTIVPNACSSDSPSKALGGEAGQGGENEAGGSSATAGGSSSRSGSAGVGAAAGEPAGGGAGASAVAGAAGTGEGGSTAHGGAGASATGGSSGSSTVVAGAAGVGAAAGEGGTGTTSAGGAGGAAGASGAAAAGGANPCDFGEASSAGTNEALNLFGQIVYFAAGETLPAGHYRIQYVDGCMKYASSQDWTVHAYADGHIGWWFVGDTSAQKIVLPPGTSGYATSNGAFATFDACVAANLEVPSTEFDFVGGKLGVWLADDNYGDNLAGTDNRNPKWKLVRLDCQ